jgi:hypothetical protein
MDKRKKILTGLLIMVGVLGASFVGSYFYFSIERAFDEIRDKNGLIIINHPGRYDQPVDWYMDLFDKYNNTIVGLEVHNQGDRYKNDRVLWDAINRQRSPYDLVWGFSNDDFHSRSHFFRSYQHLLMANLTEAELRKAMSSGATYFSYEPDGANANDPNFGQAKTPHLVNVTIQNSMILLEGTNYDNILWFNDQSVNFLNGTSVNTTTVTSNFVRAVFINEFGFTYTQPFGLAEAGIVNPYTAVNWTTTNHFKANFHTHTTQSDGKLSPEEVITAYHDAGYQILALTDHSKNTWSWTKWIDAEPMTRSSSTEYYPSLFMLAVSGIEPSNSHHFGAFFTNYNGAATDLKIALQNL